jgi:type IV pilus assembly protein PilO
MPFSLTKLPWHAQIGAFVVLALAGCGVFYYYYEVPVQADLVAHRAQLASLQAEIAKGVGTARKLPAFKREVADLQARLDDLKAVLPNEKDAADLLRRMQTVATQSNLVIKSFKPSATVNKPLHAEWPIVLELDGTYHNLAIFLDRVGRFTRIVNVSGLDVKGKDKADPAVTITATCVATTFVLLDKPVAKPAAKPAAAGTKGA